MVLPLAVVFTFARPAAVIDIHVDQPGIRVSPSLYGIFFEEINQAGDGGIYAELLRCRGLEGATADKLPAGWATVNVGGSGTVSVALPSQSPTGKVEDRASIRITRTSSAGRFGIVNEGFWGIHAQKGARYELTLWLKGDSPVDVSLEGESGKIATTRLAVPGDNWRRVHETLTASADDPKARLTIIPRSAGDLWVAYASLMPVDTWKARTNGLRKDLAHTVDAMRPAFVRFPGGCYVEGGDRLADAFNWKESILPVDQRPGIAHSMWGYSNTVGLGYHEYLQWCEDLGAEPLFVVNCGMSHREITPLDQMNRWVQDALDAIEYANGPVSSKWGALRVKNGHPEPFHLKYIEIGNENGANWSFGGPAPYGDRYKLIFDAIKSTHPEILTIADNPVPHTMEILDEHYYQDPNWFWRNTKRYDDYDRSGPKIYVGEYAVTQGCGTGNLVAALSEAAFMTGMERNSDIVTMSSYAPLLVNVNNRQWNPNAIVFDSSRCYGTPSYHVQALFANNRADRILKHTVKDEPAPPPSASGSIGLMTWNTSAEFKDIELEVDGKRAYSSNGIGRDGIAPMHGEWTVGAGLVKQTQLSDNLIAMIKGVKLDGAKRYALTLKARKLAGAEGFLIILDGTADSHLRWNIGGWNNTEHAFQRNGAVIGRPVKGKIDTGRWYTIKLEREGNKVRGFLDGVLTQELTEEGAPDFTAVAGIDDQKSEVVVKIVNGSNEARTARINLKGARVSSQARSIVLTGPSLNAENSFEQPRLIAPVTSVKDAIVPSMDYTIAPRSVTILRFPLAK